MTLAIVRSPGRRFPDCHLTHVARTPIDLGRALDQHAAYVSALREAGSDVLELPVDHEHPDACFVEDTAVVLDDLAVVARPGVDGRRGEVEAVADVLAGERDLVHIQAPGTLDGGDVLVVGDRLFVGRSTRTNEAAIEQLRRLGLDVTEVSVHGCLHLKTAVTALDDGTLVLDPRPVDAAPFAGFERIESDQPNTLTVGGVVHATAPLDTVAVRVLDIGEFAKAEGGLTCLSLIV